MPGCDFNPQSQVSIINHNSPSPLWEPEPFYVYVFWSDSYSLLISTVSCPQSNRKATATLTGLASNITVLTDRDATLSGLLTFFFIQHLLPL